MSSSVKEAHASALLQPVGEDESVLTNLFTQLTIIADRYKHDTVMESAVTGLAEVIEKLAGDGPTGRIDGSLLCKQVRDTVARAVQSDPH